MIVVHVESQSAQQVSFIKDDDIIQTLSEDRSGLAFRIRILPRRLRCAKHFLDSNVTGTLLKHLAIDSVVITDKESRS